MNVGVIGLTVSFSGFLPYGSDVRFLVIASLAIQVVALYLHTYNLWRTMKGWKGSPGEKLALDTAAAKS